LKQRFVPRCSARTENELLTIDETPTIILFFGNEIIRAAIVRVTFGENVENAKGYK